MAAAPLRPPWFGNVGVQLLAGAAVVYDLYQMIASLLDQEYGEAFLSFAWTVLFGYVLMESLRTRKNQQALAAQELAQQELTPQERAQQAEADRRGDAAD